MEGLVAQEEGSRCREIDSTVRMRPSFVGRRRASGRMHEKATCSPTCLPSQIGMVDLVLSAY